MHVKFKTCLYSLLVLLVAAFLFFVVNKNVILKTFNYNSVHIVLDSMRYNSLPKNFRKTTDLNSINGSNNLNLVGLDKLNISGSGQFSEYGLDFLINTIDTRLPITVVDLRQESHGFINGYAVSWEKSKNNANAGLNREQVLSDGTNKLRSIKLNVPVKFFNHSKFTLVPVKVQSENNVVKSRHMLYERITVRDGGIPTDDMVDYFIEFVKSQTLDSWIHFHCKEGVGRTTVFMIMYDMMKNCKKVGADDIIKRQLALLNINKANIKSFNNNKRIDFLKKFYNYCRANEDNFNINWSEWKKTSK